MTPRAPSPNRWGILVVDNDLAALSPFLELLRDSSYSVTGAVDLETAVGLVRALPFDLMIAGVRPQSATGLDLIRLAREQQPRMAVVAVTAFPDASVEHECLRLGVTYVLRPRSLTSLLRIVEERLADLSHRRRWVRKHILGGMTAQVGNAQAKLVDMSYGGFRIEMPVPANGALPTHVQVTLPSLGISVDATLVWTRNVSVPGTFLCGAALRDTDEHTTHAWRTVVDALPEGNRRN